MVTPEASSGYRLPPSEISELVDAPPTPAVSLDPALQILLVLERPSLPPISEVSRPELRLAGLRIDQAASIPSRREYFTRMGFKRISDGNAWDVQGLPDPPRIGSAQWAPDARHIAFELREPQGCTLWVAEVSSGRARRLAEFTLNGVLGTPFVWHPDSRSLFCRVVPPGRAEPPEAPAVPPGPIIQENLGKKAPSRTYQDLLRSPHDEALLAHSATSQLVRVSLDGAVVSLGEPDLTCRAAPAPGGEYLLVERIGRPFSYLVPWYRFPRRVEVWDPSGQRVRSVADLPLAEEVPIAFDAVPAGPRAFGWRADRPATLYWVEAQDGGDPSVEAEERDVMYTLSEPFDSEASVAASLQFRFAGASWGRGDLALVSERWWKTRRTRTWIVSPDSADADPRLLFDRSWEDRYGDPGSPLMRRTPQGTRVLLTPPDGLALFLVGEGASPEGDRPFLDRLNLASRSTERIWRSEGPTYERPAQILDLGGPQLLISRESVDEPTNYCVRDLGGDTLRQVTEFPHPSPQMREVRKELIRYTREDGVDLTATLYLPPAYSPDQGPLPLLMWAYPREYKSADAAGQVKDSPYRFVRITSGTALFWLTQGYAILDGPTMPIIGEGQAEANDTYVEQLVASAEAAVAEAVRRGVAERGRIAVGGHSYGGFMTANLLAHTELFQAGIARSGAYNRTLTPFGFQAEERTLWEAPGVYFGMSPFMHVEKINTPLLLIHGEADNNSGTFPIQSERLYNALKGHGKTARLVMLPHESHGYRARESVMHMLWEMHAWLERYVKRESTE